MEVGLSEVLSSRFCASGSGTAEPFADISWRSRLPESESRRLRRVQGKMVRSGILLLTGTFS